MLGVPASVRPFVTTSLLSWKGKLRAAAEPLLPRTDPDDSLGALIRARFGDEVHDRLVDALVGSIYATDTDHASLAAVPQLAELADAPPQPAARGRGRAPACRRRAERRRTDLRRPTGRDGRARRRRRALRRRSRRRASASVGRRRRSSTTARRGESTASASTPSSSPRRRGARGELLAPVAPDAAGGLAGVRARRRDHRPAAAIAAGSPAARGRDTAQRIPRAEVATAVRDRRVVRLAEVGALASRDGSQILRVLARPRRTARRPPRRRGRDRRRAQRAGRPPRRSLCSRRELVDHALARRLPPVPAASRRPRRSLRGRRSRPGSRSPAPATAASGSRPASPTVSAPLVKQSTVSIADHLT